MRALIIASVSDAIVTVPLSTSLTKFLTRSLPRSFAAASRPKRPSSTILSSRPSSTLLASSAPGTDCASAIAASQLRLELLHRVLIFERALENLLELVVPLQIAAQIRKLGAEIEQLLERPNLLGHGIRRKVVEALERHVDADLPGIGIVALQLVRDRE